MWNSARPLGAASPFSHSSFSLLPTGTLSLYFLFNDSPNKMSHILRMANTSSLLFSTFSQSLLAAVQLFWPHPATLTDCNEK